MIEAMQDELATKSSHLLLYLQSAKLRAIVRDTTTKPPDADSRLVFLSDSVYSHLIDRFRSASQYEREPIAEYLLARASDEFLLELDAACPDVINGALEIVPEPEGSDVSPKLAVRLAEIRDRSLVGDARQELLASTLRDCVAQNGWVGFVQIMGLRTLVPGFFREFVNREIETGFQSMECLYDWYAQDLSSTAHVDSAMEGLSANASQLDDALLQAGYWIESTRALLKDTHERLQRRLRERRTDIESEEDERANFQQDEWRERRMED